MNNDYNPRSFDATLSRIETKLDDALKVQDAQGKVQEDHAREMGKIWAALGRLDVRVAVIGATVSGAVALVKLLFFK